MLLSRAGIIAFVIAAGNIRVVASCCSF